jgi:hypothetical protein
MLGTGAHFISVAGMKVEVAFIAAFSVATAAEAKTAAAHTAVRTTKLFFMMGPLT